jgi:hypothetical protein
MLQQRHTGRQIAGIQGTRMYYLQAILDVWVQAIHAGTTQLSNWLKQPANQIPY